MRKLIFQLTAGVDLYIASHVHLQSADNVVGRRGKGHIHLRRVGGMLNRRDFLTSVLGAAPVAALAQAKALNLKITGLKTFVVNTGSLNWVFCKVYTNAGLVGLGEGSVTSKEATVAQAIMEHERFLIGKPPQRNLWVTVIPT